MSELDAVPPGPETHEAGEPAPRSEDTDVVETTRVDAPSTDVVETTRVDAPSVDVASTKPAGKRAASEDKAVTPSLTSSKRRVSSPRTLKPPRESEMKPVEDEDTESEPEKQPLKRAKTTTTTKKGPKTPGRKKKVLVEPAPDRGNELVAMEQKVEALSDAIKSRFGEIVWAKMGGYPYWPSIITDPRLLPQKLQEKALNVLETKYLVFFYVSNNFALISFKLIESWDDTKFKYREGYPEKDSKAPKRRVKLMEAIEAADKETQLPIEKRANGLFRPVEKFNVPSETPAPVKRKPGRPPKNKKGVKTVPKKTPKKRKDRDETESESADMKVAPEHAQEDEDVAAGPTLSKEEIKAKVASRKTPKKKGSEDAGGVAAASAKKIVRGHGKSNGSAEIDSKRKKEIELVVPHKSVKSADIREMTEEAAKKKPKSSLKKDKGEYKVGDLGSFASKMARLQAKESARNNDELVSMMQELFKETFMYRSDVERSGLAAIIAILRKSSNPTVGQTASALRKHMINILNTDSDLKGKKAPNDGAEQGTKKRKVENGSSVVVDPQQKSTVEPPPSATANDMDAKETVAEIVSPPNAAVPANQTEPTPKENVVEVIDTKTPVKVENEETAQVAPPEDVTMMTSGSDEKMVENGTTSPAQVAADLVDDAVKSDADMFETPEQIEKNRSIFVDMLSRILEHDGSQRADLAHEIEAALFERFKESNEDYLTQARIIIFGLKENATMRARLFSGALHCLEFAYADDAFFKTSE